MAKGFIWKFTRMLFGVKRRELLPRIPTHLANTYDRRVQPDVARAFTASAARSPERVRLLMKRYKVDTVDELLATLPQRPRPGPAEKLRNWLIRLAGELRYEPTPRPVIARMRRVGQLPDDVIIVRSRYPYREEVQRYDRFRSQD